MKQENEPGESVGHDNGARQGSNEAEQGQGVLVRQHEQEHEAEEPALGMTTEHELQEMGTVRIKAGQNRHHNALASQPI